MIRTSFWHFRIMKICSLLTARRHFGLQKSFIVDGFAIKFVFNTADDFIPNIIIFFNKSSYSMKKYICLVSQYIFLYTNSFLEDLYRKF